MLRARKPSVVVGEYFDKTTDLSTFTRVVYSCSEIDEPSWQLKDTKYLSKSHVYLSKYNCKLRP
jgi:hypothetical protein